MPNSDFTLTPLPVAAGIGLRHVHHSEFAAGRPPISWLEVHSENFLGGGPDLALLEKLRQDYPLSLHGVGLSLGSAEGLDSNHLARLAELVRRIQPTAISDHVSWSVTGGVYFNDLIPVPYDDEALQVMATNVQRFQDAVGRMVLVENASTYVEHAQSTMTEPEFLKALCQRTGCGLLLDVNNVYVTSENHGLDAGRYLEEIADLPIGEIHLSGHHLKTIGNRSIRIDDHGSRVSEAVWSLYDSALDLVGPKPTLIEWDCAIPALGILLDEASKAQARLDYKRRLPS